MARDKGRTAEHHDSSGTHTGSGGVFTNGDTQASDEVFNGDDASASDELADDGVALLQRELTAERDKNLRLVAEFDNYRKRMMKGMIESESRGQADLVKTILDPLDDISRFAHIDPSMTDSRTLVEGVEMVEKKLAKSLRAAGLDIIDPVGEKFDPASHEAVSTDTAESDEEDGTVSRVFQVGYTFKGQLLRPARVVVRQHDSAS